MKSPLSQLLLVSVFIAIGLWVGVKWFLGETEEFPDNMDIRSLEYLRDGAPASDTLKTTIAESESASQQSLPSTAFSASEYRRTSEDFSDEVEEDNQPAEDPDEKQREEDKEKNEEFAREIAGEIARDEEKKPDDANRQHSYDNSSEETELAIDEDDGGSESEERGAETVVLGVEEVDARERARKRRLAELGLVPKKRPEPTIAVDVSLIMPEPCEGAVLAAVPVGLKFRHKSSVITGHSLNSLETMVALYRNCQQGQFVLAENPLGREDATDTLRQMRFDEVKYFFIQHSVPIDVVQFPEEK